MRGACAAVSPCRRASGRLSIRAGKFARGDEFQWISNDVALRDVDMQQPLRATLGVYEVRPVLVFRRSRSGFLKTGPGLGKMPASQVRAIAIAIYGWHRLPPAFRIRQPTCV